MEQSAQNSFESVDDFLGPSASRFFGSGYRRIGEHIGGLSLVTGPDGHGSVKGTARVVFPADWSVKRQGGVRPHLSTIDALVFAARLAELYLTAAYGLGPEERSRMWLRRVDIRAGSAPTETELDNLAVSAALKSTDDAPHSPRGRARVSVLNCRVAQMAVRCEVEHAAGIAVPATLALDSPDDLLGPASQRPYGDGFRNQRNHITDVAVSADSLAADARLAVGQADSAAVAEYGLEGAYQPSMTLVEAFVVALQLGQVLLYRLDAVPRAESQTLWMRRTTLEADSPHRDAAQPAPVRAELVDPMLVESADGVWRSADIVSDCLGVRTRCLVSHRLPADAASRLLPSS